MAQGLKPEHLDMLNTAEEKVAETRILLQKCAACGRDVADMVKVVDGQEAEIRNLKEQFFAGV